MHLPEPIRIISDLHLGYSGSLVTDAAQLRPLLAGVGTIVLNGDTAEMRGEKHWPDARGELEKLRGLCAEARVQSVFINGNHDPAISSVNHLDLLEGAVLATHGDMLYHDLAPWSKEAKALGLAHSELLEGLDDSSFTDFEARLRLMKDAIHCVELPDLRLHSGRLARVAMFARECWPPTRPFKILRCWHDAPGRAVALAQLFRPRARFILIGHTHLGGVTRVGSRVVINTGSFTPLLGRFLVDIEDGALTVRHIRRDHGVFAPGRDVRRFRVVPAAALARCGAESAV